MTLTPQAFIQKWRSVTLTERASYQQHFLDLCELVNHPKPAEIDASGDTFCFEKGAAKAAGGQGFADVWYRNHFAWEYKGPHANLDKAYQQLQQYREALENPPLLIVSDIQTIKIHTNFTGTVKRVDVLTLDDLANPGQLGILRTAFFDPYALRAQMTPDQVTEQAAAHFAELAEILRKRGHPPAEVAHFLIRLLFCLFAEDTELLPARLFTTMAARLRANPPAFARQLSRLFAEMAAGGFFGADEIPHFDGRLFDDAQALELPTEAIDILLEVSRLDWAAIEPSIFGTLFERSLDPDKRSQLGAHYTGREEILLIVEPVLMAPLRRRWVQVRAEGLALSAQRDEARGAKRANLDKKLASLLTGFMGELSAVRVLDAACGSGNFLYIALRQMLDLWNEVSTFGAQNGLTAFNVALAPTPAQLLGIEVNETAHQLAQAAIQIGYIQWLRENGQGRPAEPILKPLDTIRRQDAILARDPQGRAVEPDWPEADVIIGNPPFLGGNKVRAEIGSQYVDALFQLYAGRVPAFADLVCYWFEKARDQIARGRARRAGLLATQGIRGGANRRVLERIKESGDIFFAWSDRDWVLDGATVHVSMVGFDDGSESCRELDGAPVGWINADLSSSHDLTQAARLRENADISFVGDTKKGKFDIPPETAAAMLAAAGNPNGRPNADVIRPWINGLDITQRGRNMWIIDFGVNMPLEAAAQYEMPFEHVRRHVKPERDQVRNEIEKKNWWIHGRSAPDLREAIAPLERYIATPRVAKHRLFVFIPASTLPDGQVVIFAREDDYTLGVLHARAHELWARATGTQLRDAESGFRYSQTMTFETYPFPWPPGQEPECDPRVAAVSQAARSLLSQRDRWLAADGLSPEEQKKRTLTGLYNARPIWLENAHAALDQAVFAAYGWEDSPSDEQILARLLDLNRQRAGNGAAPAGPEEDRPD